MIRIHLFDYRRFYGTAYLSKCWLLKKSTYNYLPTSAVDGVESLCTAKGDIKKLYLLLLLTGGKLCVCLMLYTARSDWCLIHKYNINQSIDRCMRKS